MLDELEENYFHMVKQLLIGPEIPKPFTPSEADVANILKPETELEKNILSDTEFLEGALWGDPRQGHPEGQVIFHVREVLNNLDKYSKTYNREKLRLIAFVHDTFKHKVDLSKPRTGDNHHAVIARTFLEKYCSDNEILEIVELHDEAFNAWQKGNRDGNWDKAKERATKLIIRLKKSLDLYLTFYKCDNETGDKNQDSYHWFEKLARISEPTI